MKTRPLGTLPGPPTGPRPGQPGRGDVLVAYADLLARFAHRFADRSGVLDARGLGEPDFEALEEGALAVLDAALTHDDLATLRCFAEAVSRARRGLAEAPAASEPTTRASSTWRRAADEEAPNVEPPAPDPAPPATPDVDPADLMATLSSEISKVR